MERDMISEVQAMSAMSYNILYNIDNGIHMQRNVLISQVKINTLLSGEESISSIVLVVALLFNNLCTSSLFKNNIQIINTQIT